MSAGSSRGDVHAPELSGRMRVVFWCVMIAGTLVLGEVLTRMVVDPPGLYPRRPEYALITDHPVRGYAMLPGAAIRYRRGGQSSSAHINGHGFRDEPIESARGASMRLLGVGDSFTFGLGVDSTDSWPEQLEAMLLTDVGPGVSVVNAGIPGYSARQMRQVVEELMPDLRPDVVFFGMNPETYWRVDAPYVYLGGQLIATAALPMVRVGHRGLYYSRYAHRPWLSHLDLWLNQHFELGAHILELTHRFYGRLADRGPESAPAVAAPVELERVSHSLEPVLEEILKAREVARAGGAKFAVLLINPQSRDGSFAKRQLAYNRTITDFCRAHDIGVVDPLPVLIDAAKGRPIFRSSDDYHWTRIADSVAAGELHRYLSQSGLVTRDWQGASAAGRIGTRR